MKKIKCVEDMTREELKKVPFAEEYFVERRCRAFVIIPGSGAKKELHDSGFRCMSFVLVNEKNEPICQTAGCSDVVHIEGIGGYGYKSLEKQKDSLGLPVVTPVGWAIDCLPKSGCLRLFGDGEVVMGAPMSSFEVWIVKKETNK